MFCIQIAKSGQTCRRHSLLPVSEALQLCRTGDWAVFSSAQSFLQIRLAMDLNEMG